MQKKFTFEIRKHKGLKKSSNRPLWCIRAQILVQKLEGMFFPSEMKRQWQFSFLSNHAQPLCKTKVKIRTFLHRLIKIGVLGYVPNSNLDVLNTSAFTLKFLECDGNRNLQCLTLSDAKVRVGMRERITCGLIRHSKLLPQYNVTGTTCLVRVVLPREFGGG